MYCQARERRSFREARASALYMPKANCGLSAHYSIAAHESSDGFVEFLDPLAKPLAGFLI